MSDAPHIAFPVRLVPSGQLATVEEDSLDEVAQTVYWLTSTEPGTAPDLPDAGVPSPAFVRGDVEEQIADLVRDQEPRAAIDAVRLGLSDIELEVSLAS